MVNKSSMTQIERELDPRDMPPGTKVWIYLRHSPGDNQTLESQESAIMHLIRQKQWNVTRVFRDRGISGKSTEDRQGFELMIYLARQKPRPADILIIWEFSRFARNQDHSQFYRAELRMNDWQLLSMKDDIPSGPMGRIYEALIDWKNEQFLIDLRANTIRGLRFIAEKECLPVGTIGKGYTHHEVQIGMYRDGEPRMGRKPDPDPQIAPLIVKAFEMKARGAPYAAIAEETGLYSANSGSWNHLFSNRIYIGEYEFRGEVFTNIYPPLISKELFDAVQKQLPERKHAMKGRHHPRRKGSTFFLGNIAVCGQCGANMEGKRVGNYRYYVCSRHNESAELCPDAALIPADEVEEQILQTLLNCVLAPDYLGQLLMWTNDCLNSGLDELNLRVENIRKELSEANRLARQLARNFGTMETPSRIAEQLLMEQESAITRLQTELSGLEQELENSQIEVSQDAIQYYVTQARAMIESAEFFDLREVCEQLSARIVMHRDECHIELHFPCTLEAQQ